MSTINRALYIGPDNQVQAKDFHERYVPSERQALIEVEYSGVNPADIKHGEHLGLNDHICGYECCGTVIETGASSPFAVGDIIFGFNATGKDKPPSNAAHQRWVIAESGHMWTKLPANIPHVDAAVLSITVRAAADALFSIFGLSLPSAGIEGSSKPGGIVIWGGASSVGIAAIQLSKAVGLDPIIVTASQKNHEALLELGATKCFDYKSPTVVRDIQLFLDSATHPLAYIFDTISKEGENSTTANCEALTSTGEVKYASVMPIFGSPKWTMVMSSRAFDFPSEGGFCKARPELEPSLQKAVQWTVDNYGNGFVVPRVRVVKDTEAAIQAILDSGHGKISFEKIAIQHPLS